MIVFEDKKQNTDRVPQTHTYGSVTDGEWVCGRCGDFLTGCALCAGEVRHVVPVNKLWGRT